MIGSLSALSGTGIWLIVATFFNLPVSGTHSVVGATMGYALVAHGLSGVKWKTFGLIGERIEFIIYVSPNNNNNNNNFIAPLINLNYNTDKNKNKIKCMPAQNNHHWLIRLGSHP